MLGRILGALVILTTGQGLQGSAHSILSGDICFCPCSTRPPAPLPSRISPHFSTPTPLAGLRGVCIPPLKCTVVSAGRFRIGHGSSSDPRVIARGRNVQRGLSKILGASGVALHGNADEGIVEEGDFVLLHYIAELQDTGEEFDSTYERKPVFFEVGAGRVMRGLEMAVRAFCP